ncbi:hypothetical protein [Paenibacillus agricola]|uniref:Uncharacterized protein n=1 Tax=Paenibacillus agricola TaxID=2716264 RepID=A0ABX0J9I9_9BACL|nr:hypothetical protein [Paenibacillus agricola]NHN32618.1 hypothetical protein [Paenibacillus agricola]
MANRQDLTAQLPDGQMFQFWEVEQKYDREIHGDNKNPLASDENSVGDEDRLRRLTQQCFAPKVPFLSYIRVKGLTLAHATLGSPIPQRGSLSCYRECTRDKENVIDNSILCIDPRNCLSISRIGIGAILKKSHRS